MKDLDFTLDLPKNLVASLNSIYAGSHWHKRHAMKEAYIAFTRAFFKILAKDYTINEPCEISFIFSGTRIKDCDNHAFMGKMIQDCLVEHGVIVEDSANYIAKVSYAKAHKPKGQKGVSVKVEIRGVNG